VDDHLTSVVVVHQKDERNQGTSSTSYKNDLIVFTQISGVALEEKSQNHPWPRC